MIAVAARMSAVRPLASAAFTPWLVAASGPETVPVLLSSDAAAAAPCPGMRATAVLAAFATSASALSSIASKNASMLSKT